ncbi:hypothetical protein NY547_04480 [Cnuibacter physcomitrellae]|uniref:hypothetical protein n=1 Tax=Cnuibacter physcomitrellae TaxID=1619308 RepID=UPI0021758B61|nr:hypothetical protein [Cnuibacter physcomitrellae]MCS5496493.1 hypothetical protein [Cnuibacter physcomitrellae]
MDDREMDGIELVGGILMVLASAAVVYGSRNNSSIGVILGCLGIAGGIAMIVVRFRRTSRRRAVVVSGAGSGADAGSGAARGGQTPNGSV